jgi:hypothetical protein
VENSKLFRVRRISCAAFLNFREVRRGLMLFFELRYAGCQFMHGLLSIDDSLHESITRHASQRMGSSLVWCPKTACPKTVVFDHSKLRFSCVQIEVLGGLKFVGFLERAEFSISPLFDDPQRSPGSTALITQKRDCLSRPRRRHFSRVICLSRIIRA